MNKLFGLIAAGLFAAFAGAHAQPYPSKQITFYVPSTAGGSLDSMARIVADRIQQKTGQSVIVENRPGGGGTVAAQPVAKAAPDGYSVFAGANVNLAVSIFTKNLSVDLEKDLMPVTTLMYGPLFIAVHDNLGVKDLKGLVAYAKANPGKLNTAATAATGQVLDEINFNSRAGVDIRVITYRGGADSLRAFVSNEVQVFFGPLTGIRQYVDEGKMHILAVANSVPFPLRPSVPTAKSAGVDYEAVVKYGFFMTPGTPKPVVDRFVSLVEEIAKEPATLKRIETLGLAPQVLKPDAFAASLRKDMDNARAAAKVAKIQPE